MAAKDPAWARANLDKLEPMLNSAQFASLQDEKTMHQVSTKDFLNQAAFISRESYTDAKEEVEQAADEEAILEEELFIVRDVYTDAIRTVKDIDKMRQNIADLTLNLKTDFVTLKKDN